MITPSSLKTRLFQGLLAVSMLGGLSSSAFAIQVGDSGTGVNNLGSYQNGTGGEFYFRPTAGLVSNTDYAATTKEQGAGGVGSFQTFCLEMDEFIAKGSVDYVVNNQAVGGGNNTDAGDPISVGTAWLYSQFAQGILDDYFTGNRFTNAGLLQNAIWALEEEFTLPAAYNNAILNNPFFDAAVTYAANLPTPVDVKSDATTGYLGVWVLNNTVGNTKKQDMLYYEKPRTPGTTGNPVPDGGATVALLGLSLAGLSLAARFHRKSTAA